MTKLKDLTSVGAVTNADFIYISQSDTDYKATREQIVLAVQTQLDADVLAINAEITNIKTGKLALTGGTMLGSLVLSGPPTTGLEPATKTYTDSAVAALAPLASPIFTGVPEGTTAATGTNTTQLATTAFLQTELDTYLFTTTTVAAATKNLAEAESGRVNVNYTPTGTVTIGLPDSTTLVSPNRVSYNVNDIGNNANINNIIVNTSGSDTFIGGATTYSITRDGDSIEFYLVGTIWYQNKTKISASLTEAGQIKLASSAEAIAMVEDTKAVTSAKVGDILDNTVLRVQELGAATKTLVESERGLWQITYTNTGPVSITLPDTSALTSTVGTYYEFVDSGNASVNTITISTTGGNTINGLSTYTITNTRAGAYFFIDSTNNWVTKNDTENAIDTAGVDSETVIAYGAGAGAIPITSTRVNYTSVGAFEALTLIDGTVGQKLKIVHVVDGGSGILTPTSLLGYTTVTFNDQGDSVELQYGTGGWAIISVFNATIA